eukprot:2135534-Rhodomonas_salina.1
MAASNPRRRLTHHRGVRYPAALLDAGSSKSNARAHVPSPKSRPEARHHCPSNWDVGWDDRRNNQLGEGQSGSQAPSLYSCSDHRNWILADTATHFAQD